MLTVMHRDPVGNEVIEEREFVSYCRSPVRNGLESDAEIVRGPGLRMWTPGEQETIFDAEGHKGWTIFVMNRFGATVATYRL